MNTKASPAGSKLSVLKQICNLIPGHLVSNLARETGAAEKARSFSNWSHVVSLLFAQLAHSIGLNDVADALQLHRGALAGIRGAVPPSRNGLSHANTARSADLAERLLLCVLEHLGQLSPEFIRGRARGRAHRFKVPIHIVDTTVIELVANALDWARHRRRKAAAKTHMRLNLQRLLPQCVIVDTAREHDNRRWSRSCPSSNTAGSWPTSWSPCPTKRKPRPK